MIRADGRDYNAIRTIKITPNFIEYAPSSILIELGNTKVICTITLLKSVPPFLKNKGKGWLTAEYAMLPVATHIRNQRESMSYKRQGRTVEISRLIGRIFRSIVDLNAIGEQTILIDCDVIQADGGTRTAAITGTAYALYLAQDHFLENGDIDSFFIKDEVAAISAGIVNGECILDLNYSEDSAAELDFNFVLTKSGKLIEVQGTAEQAPIVWETFDKLRELASSGIAQIFDQLEG